MREPERNSRPWFGALTIMRKEEVVPLEPVLALELVLEPVQVQVRQCVSQAWP